MKKLLLALTGLAFISEALACTTFFMNSQGQLVFGRNYDWVTGTGLVHTNQRGLLKSSLPLADSHTIQWTSKYGSITFNQYGKEFPTGGMNEKGLVVELMWLSESRFPRPDERPALSVLQWIQYQLDNAATIEEVIASDKTIRIDAQGAPQHYLIADARGQAATVEFLNGKMVVHQGAELPYAVLSNSSYRSSVDAWHKLDQDSATVINDHSLRRFATACSRIRQAQQAPVNQPLTDYAFDILKEVAQGDYTKWSIVYDIAHKKIHFKTAAVPEVRTVNFESFDFSCTAKPVSLDINQPVTGDVRKAFSEYASHRNRAMLKQAFAESRSQVTVTEENQEAMARLADAASCRQ